MALSVTERLKTYAIIKQAAETAGVPFYREPQGTASPQVAETPRWATWATHPTEAGASSRSPQ